MSEQTKQLIINIFDAACVKQFQSLGCEIGEARRGSHSNEVMVSYITAGSEDLTISLLLKTPRLLLAQTMPIVDFERISDPKFQEDWNCELANRFLGRIKNSLVEYNCRLDIGLPESLQASELKHFKCIGDEVIRHFAVSNELIDSVLDCHLYLDVHNDSFTLTDRTGLDKDSGDESSLVIL
jgi:hypothetical protein